jgi:hypothetical protein
VTYLAALVSRGLARLFQCEASVRSRRWLLYAPSPSDKGTARHRLVVAPRALRALESCAPISRDHAREHERKSDFRFAVGNETRNPPRRGRVLIKCWGMACAQVAKKPNHKSGGVNRPADAFGICHPTPPGFSAAVATSQAYPSPISGPAIPHQRWGQEPHSRRHQHSR